MNRWWNRLRFLWEEESPPPEEAPRADREEPAGVPRPLRRVTRFSLTAVVATSLMGQVVGVRLIAPVDAGEDYTSACIQECTAKFKQCLANCPIPTPPGKDHDKEHGKGHGWGSSGNSNHGSHGWNSSGGSNHGNKGWGSSGGYDHGNHGKPDPNVPQLPDGTAISECATDCAKELKECILACVK